LERISAMIKSIYALIFASLIAAPALADDLSEANQLFKQGQNNAAFDKVNAHLSVQPNDAKGRFLKGLILTAQNKPNDAIKIFTSLTSDFPELPEPYNNLAVLYAGQGQYDKAKQSLELAIRTHPSYATAHENLGDIYAKMASQAYDRALQLDKSNSGTQTKLSMIQDLFTNAPRSKSNPIQSAAAGSITVKPIPKPPAVAAITPAPPAEIKPAPLKPTVADIAVKPALNNKPAPAETPNEEQDVLDAVQAWARAWSAQNTKQYLAAYAADFRPADGESRAAWAESRRERITTPQSIHVNVSDVNVKISDASHASARFKQSYQASHLQTSSHKTLQLVKNNGKWLIQEERAK
jgi:tetratricopeptide (TPR) repeat protein